MKLRERRLLNRWSVAAHACILTVLALLPLLTAWVAYRQLQLVRLGTLAPEVHQLRTSAARMVGRIEQLLADEPDPTDLTALEAAAFWLRREWHERLDFQERRTYAAIVDNAQMVVMHTNPALEGQTLERRWYDRSVLEVGEDVVETRSVALAAGERAYDVQVPIVVEGQLVGEYHAGLDAGWLERQVADEYSAVFRRWVAILAGIGLLVALAAMSLAYLAADKLALFKAIRWLERQRLRELGQLARGLAHEVRNPLHAIRLNLHAMQRLQSDPMASLSAEDAKSMIQDTNREIDRVDRLMQDLVTFASPDEPRDEDVDVRDEVESTLRFLGQELKRQEIRVETRFTGQEAMVRIDPSRLRQVLVNLLLNASEALGRGGEVALAVERRGDQVDITVADNGPGVAATNLDRVFDPFFSTKAGASGLGLAQVRRFIADAGGQVRCEDNGAQGAQFRVSLPARDRTRRDRTTK